MKSNIMGGESFNQVSKGRIMDVQAIYKHLQALVQRNTTTTFALTSLLFLVVYTYFYLRNKYSYWEKRGLKNPKPAPFFGNFVQLFTSDRPKLETLWVKKYGKVYGVYYGTTPRLVIADPEIIREITTKSFDSFQNHSIPEFGSQSSRSFIFFLQGDHWKKVRALMSPTFTSGKIKKMFKALGDCADDLVQCFREKLPDEDPNTQRISQVNTKELFNLFTMDGISTCCYGIKLKRDGATDLKTTASRDEFVRIAMEFFQFSKIRMIIAMTVPKAILRFFGFTISTSNRLLPLEKKVEGLISWRREGSKKYSDYLQLLVDAKLDDKLELNELDMEENHHAGLTHDSLVKDQEKLIVDVVKNQSIKSSTLSDTEIKVNAMSLLAVGLETTSTLLANCTYALAFHQRIQQQLYEELEKIAEFDEDKKNYSFNYDALTSCTYLDAVISETLRALAPITQIDRVANKSYHIKKYNLDVPKGSIIQLAYYAVMNDPYYWDEPTKFNPDRFMPGNKENIVPGSYCPFGLGPRHCVGMRFSLTEAKLALAKLMMSFKFDPAPEHSYPPKSKPYTLGLNNLASPSIRIITRH